METKMFYEKLAEFMVEDGFSVLELCRIMRSKRADLLHDEMRKKGVIQSAPRMNPRKNVLQKKQPEVPASILKYFDGMNYSFGLWCAGHELDQGTAKAMLAQRMIAGDEDSERVHRAAMRDFPITYRKIYKTEPLDVRWAGRIKLENYSFAQVWEEENRRYAGKIKEFLDDPDPPIGYGDTPEKALENVKEELKKKLILKHIASVAEKYSSKNSE